MRPSIGFALFFTAIFTISLQAQTTIWLEDFNGANQGWVDFHTDCDGTAASFAGQRNNRFEIQDMEGSPCCTVGGGNNNNWTANPINIAGFCDVSISINYGFSGDFECQAGGPYYGCAGNSTIDNGHDQLQFEYNLNNTGWQQFWYVCGGSSGNAFVNGLSGNTLQIRVRGANKASSEIYWFDDVLVQSQSASTVAITGNASVCNGQATTLNAVATGGSGYTYSWSNGATSSSITINPAATANFTVTVTNSAGCTTTASQLVSVGGNPTVSISGTTAICAGSSSTLTAAGSGGSGFTYLWSNGETDAVIVVSPTLATTYTVSATNSAGCSATASQNISINPGLTPSIAGNLAICIGASSNLSVSGLAAGVYTYNWSNGATTASINVTPSSNIAYQVTVTAANGCSGTNSNTVQVNPLPTVQILGNGASCSAQSDTLTALANGGTSFSYAWSTGATSSSIAVVPNSGATYQVTVTNQNGCTASDTVVGTVVTPPTVSILGQVQACAGETLTFTADAQGGTGFTYLWSSGQTTSSVNLNLNASFSPQVTVTSSNGCQASASLNVNVTALPIINITGNSTLCAGASTTLTANVSNTAGTVTYLWSSGEANTSINLTPASSQTLTVTATHANGCSASQTATITVNPLPVITLTGDTNVCIGSTGAISASSTGGNSFSYLWSTGETSSSIVTNPTVITTYSITATNNFGCTSTANFDVFPSSMPEIFAESNFTNACPNQQITLTAYYIVSAAFDFDYQWGANANNSPDSLTTITFTGGTQTYSVTATNLYGCTISDSVQVSESSLNMTVNTIQPLCPGDDGQITVDVLNGTAPFTYSYNNGQSFVNDSFSTLLPPSQYTVIARDQFGCQANQSTTIVDAVGIILSISPNSYDISLGDSVQLEATVQAVLPATYIWTPANDLSCNNCVQPYASPLESTNYTLLVTDGNGCTATASAQVNIFKNRTVFIPNAFTPNDDNLNDYFTAYADEQLFEITSMLIYNRWGNLVFESRNFQPGQRIGAWDGTYKGQEQNVDSYVYIINVEFVDGHKEQLQGDLTLIR